MKIILLVTSLALLLESEKLCLDQVGVIEKGKNKGERIRMYLASVGLAEGHPYCMAGIYWAFDSASKKLNVANPLVKTGSTVVQFKTLEKIGIRGGKIDRHSLIFWRLGKQWKGHVGRILFIYSAGWIYTIEFNTGGRDEREGDGVWLKYRNLYHPLARMQVLGVVSWQVR